MKTLSKEQKADIKAIKEMTKKVTSSKKNAEKYLQESGIAAFVKRATKEARNGVRTSNNQ